MFARACLYYLRCTGVNRLTAMLRRLRQPKYLICLTLTVVYFWAIFFANPVFSGQGADPAVYRRNAAVMFGAFYLLQIVLSWFSLSSGRGVGFRESEVQILFPRPFTRAQILLLKALGAQLPMIIGALLIGLFTTRWGGFSYACVVLGFWFNQILLYAHVTLMGLLLAWVKGRGGAVARLVRAPAWLLLGATASALVLGWQEIGGVTAWADAAALLATPFLSVLMTPFAAMAQLVAAPDLAALASNLTLPVSLLVAHVLLIRILDFRFEDQAVDIAAKIQKIQREGIGALQAKKDLVVRGQDSPWPLRPTGPVWMALVWKNVISLGRFPRSVWVRVLVFVAIVAVCFSAFDLGGDGDTLTRMGWILLVILLYGAILGTALVRVDLRIDIPHFDVLKSMPFRGRSLIFGEVMGSVVVLWSIQAVGSVLAAFMITQEGEMTFAWADKLPALLGLLIGFFALDFALLTGENLFVLWLPGFARLGRGIKPGLDQVGQNLMGALIRLLVLLVLFVLPVTLGVLLAVVGQALGMGPVWAVSAGVAVGSVLLCCEAGVLILLSERRYQSFDISSGSALSE